MLLGAMKARRAFGCLRQLAFITPNEAELVALANEVRQRRGLPGPAFEVPKQAAETAGPNQATEAAVVPNQATQARSLIAQLAPAAAAVLSEGGGWGCVDWVEMKEGSQGALELPVTTAG